MSRFTKIALLVAMIACAVGIVFYLGGFLVLYLDSDSAYNNTDNRTYTFTEQIDTIDVDMSCGSLNIAHGGSDLIVECTDVYIPGLTVHCSEGRLVIITESEKDATVGGWRFGHNFGRLFSPSPVIDITIPDGTELSQVRAEIGAGDLTADVITADRVVLQVATGDVSIDNLLVSELAGIQIGAGNFKTLACDVMGLEVTVGTGNVAIYTTEGYQDYSIDTSCGVGTIQVGEHTSDAFECEIKHGSSSGRSITVRDEAGSIRID